MLIRQTEEITIYRRDSLTIKESKTGHAFRTWNLGGDRRIRVREHNV